MTESVEPLAHQLDAARIPNWSKRLTTARWAGPDAFAREWASIKAEYFEAIATAEDAT